MKIAITGASGFVGKQIIPILKESGFDLLLVGRDQTKLQTAFPNFETTTYANLGKVAKGVELLIHLAVLNSDAKASYEEYQNVNVTLFRKILEKCNAAGIKRVINVSSFHVVPPCENSRYANSKAQAFEIANATFKPEVITVFLPAIYGDKFGGKLRFLNRTPVLLRRGIFEVLSALKPTVSILELVNFIRNIETKIDRETEYLLSTPQSNNIVFILSKKMLDLLFVGVIAGFFWWLLVLVWVAIRLDSSGPGFFLQERIGRNGVTFTCYKFRTMYVGTKQAETHHIASRNVTKIGIFLRGTKLDELPQILNILKGELSLIGPRPCLPNQAELIKHRKNCGVLELTPGISGLAQINNIDMSSPKLLALWDYRYKAQQSILLDIRIIIATILGRGQGDRTTNVGDI
jgi:lipopolysaccharide/colanic/teichoic acid biosynthesis glycosyltransferase